MLQSFSQNIPVSQTILDAHETVVSKMEAANKAVYEALMAVMSFEDPMAENLFGAEREHLQAIVATSRSRLLEIFQTGVPIFSIRLASEEFKGVLADNPNGDAVMQAMLRTFGEPLRLASLK